MALIKCPECGREISSRAHSCPHCGEENPLLTPSKPKEQHTPVKEAERKRKPINKKQRRLILIGSAAGALLLIGGGWILYHNHKLAEQQEMAYTQLMDNFSIADAETFLLRYPDTEYKKQIQDNIALYQRYAQEWDAIANSNNADDFAMFRSRFPNSPFDQLAYDKIDSIDWTIAMRRDDEDAMQNYLNLHPDGKYAELARETKQNIINSRPNDDERLNITRNLTYYFSALTDGNKDRVAAIAGSSVYDKTSSLIDKNREANIVGYVITSPVNISKAPTESGFTYTATCRIERTSINPDGNSESNSFSVRATLNSQMKITDLTGIVPPSTSQDTPANNPEN